MLEQQKLLKTIGEMKQPDTKIQRGIIMEPQKQLLTIGGLRPQPIEMRKGKL